MNKKPAKDYQKQYKRYSMTAEMTQESRLREQAWLKNGCNGFDMKKPKSTPMAFWYESDVLQYLKENKIPLASVYGDIVYEVEGMQYDTLLCEGYEKCLSTTGCKRTGCVFCGYGLHLDKSPTRFEMLKQTHPKLYNYCLGGGGYNEQGVWQPTKEGLGMKHIFDELNKIYGKDFIRY